MIGEPSWLFPSIYAFSFDSHLRYSCTLLTSPSSLPPLSLLHICLSEPHQLSTYQVEHVHNISFLPYAFIGFVLLQTDSQIVSQYFHLAFTESFNKIIISGHVSAPYHSSLFFPGSANARFYLCLASSSVCRNWELIKW